MKILQKPRKVNERTIAKVGGVALRETTFTLDGCSVAGCLLAITGKCFLTQLRAEGKTAEASLLQALSPNRCRRELDLP